MPLSHPGRVGLQASVQCESIDAVKTPQELSMYLGNPPSIPTCHFELSYGIAIRNERRAHTFSFLKLLS